MARCLGGNENPVCSPYGLLPIETLALIFDFIPLRSRILIVSTICRRWRRAALCSVTSPPSHLSWANAIALFPNSTKVRIPAKERCSFVPLSLCSLSIYLPLSNENHDAPCECKPFCVASSLHTLVLHQPKSCSCAHDLLVNNTASLTSLSLSLEATTSMDVFCSVLPTLRFPALKSLSLSNISRTGMTIVTKVLESLLGIYRDQLSSFSVHAVEPFRFNSSTLGLPNCQHLSFAFVSSSTKESITPFLRLAPNATTVNLTFPYSSWRDILPQYGAYVTSLNLQQVSHVEDEFCVALSACSRLASFSMSDKRAAVLYPSSLPAALLPRASQLTRLEFPKQCNLQQCVPLLSQSSSLTQLVLNDSFLLDSIPFAFPYLHHLRLYHNNNGGSTPRVLSWLTHLLAQCPRLRFLLVQLWHAHRHRSLVESFP